MKNIFYFQHINVIGGVETFFYYIAKKYQNRDITIYYRTGDEAQIKRLKKYVRVKRYQGEVIKCEKAFFNYNLDIIDKVIAKEYIQILHGDYKAIGFLPNMNPKITKYIGVSQLVCDTFKELTGIEAELCYNPVEIDKTEKVLRLVSATRLTIGKGKPRMQRFAELLDRAGVNYTWTIFTNDTNAIKNPNIIYAKPRLDIINHIRDADYLVQLSNTEAYCYSVVEALTVGTPVIVTDLPVYKEIGLNANNSFIVDFELSNVPIEKIYKGLPKFEYKPKADKWDVLLAKGKSTYQDDMKKIVKVQCITPYYDVQLFRNMNPEDEPFEVNKIRAETLAEAGVCKEVNADGNI